jgi:hypothetical protein
MGCMQRGTQKIRQRNIRKHAPVLRAVIEIASIIFLFYANLLMGQYVRHVRRPPSLLAAMQDVITPANFAIAIITAFIGYIVFELLRRKLR